MTTAAGPLRGHPAPGLNGPARAALFAAFLLSGACGLAYEVVWTRLIAREVGHTSFALATVLASFMGGLALGSWIAGRVIGRLRNPVGWYGALEVAIGVTALAVPVLLRQFHPAIGWLYRSEALGGVPCHAARFAICGAVLLLPTTCMGATLPLLAEPLVRRREELGGTLGWLYATNTLGAAAGALLAGFFALPAFGMAETVRAAAAVNVAVGLVAIAVSRGAAVRARAREAAVGVPGPEGTPRAGGRPLFLWGMLLSGALAMANQVVWTRYLSLQIGTSVYAFTIIVSAFILGMAAGSLFFGRRADRSRDTAAAFGGLQVAIGFSCLLLSLLLILLAMGVWDLVQATRGSFARTQAAFFLACFSIVFLPTFFLGGTFPTAVRGYVPEGAATGPAVGRVYAWNTVGAILGSFAGGFVVVPRLGLMKAILVLGVANVALGAWALVRSAAPRRWLAAGASLVAAGAGALAMPDWSDQFLLHGAYVLAVYDASWGHREEWTSPLVHPLPLGERICFHRDGASASVSVVATQANFLSLRINGRTQASNAEDMQTQVLIAQLPMLLHPGPVREVLTVGLGSGVTTGSATVHPGVHVDAVEISPEVVEAARRYFAEENLRVCDRPDAARVVVEDARSHITFTDRRYDVICAEPSHVFISGMGDLFTREYYEACRASLAPGGTMSQWVQAYWHTPEDIRTIIATFLSVFPRAWLWEITWGGDYLLVGATEGLDPAAVTARWTGPVAGEMARIGFDRPAQLFAGYLAGPRDLAAWAAGARLQEDDTIPLEFSSPRWIYEGRVSGMDLFRGLRSPVPEAAGWPEGALACRQARTKGIAITMDKASRVRERLERSIPLLGLDPDAADTVRRLALVVSETEDQGIDEVARRLRPAIDLWLRAGQVAFRAGRTADAERWLKETAATFPRAAEPLFELAEVLRRTGRPGAEEVERLGWERWRAIKRGMDGRH